MSFRQNQCSCCAWFCFIWKGKCVGFWQKKMFQFYAKVHRLTNSIIIYAVDNIRNSICIKYKWERGCVCVCVDGENHFEIDQYVNEEIQQHLIQLLLTDNISNIYRSLSSQIIMCLCNEILRRWFSLRQNLSNYSCHSFKVL